MLDKIILSVGTLQSEDKTPDYTLDSCRLIYEALDVCD